MNIQNSISRRLHSPTLWIGLLIVIIFFVMGVILRDYGESWDEYNFFNYAHESLAAYRGLFDPGFRLTFNDPTLRHYGPWFWMLCVLISRLFPGAYISDVAHGLTFLTSLIGILGMYMLARRWLKPWTAFGITLLFAAQPLLWGHAFINARDIPFLAGFILTIYFGLRLKDSLPELLPPDSHSSLDMNELRRDWQALKRPLRVVKLMGWISGITASAWVALSLTNTWLARAPLLADTTSVHDLDLYLRQIFTKFWGGAIFISLVFLWSSLIFLPFLPRLGTWLWESELKPRLQQTILLLRTPLFWVAAVSLGFTSGIRIVGWMAGALVCLFLWQKYRVRALIPISIYSGLGFLSMYLTWPYLWGEPFLRFLITFRLMLRFPWPGSVLFDGKYYAGNEVPQSYLPFLNAVQVTEPLLFMAIIGLVLLLWKTLQRRSLDELGSLVLFWYGLPVALAVFGRPYLYDNFRQFLFILPPLFLLAGLALEEIVARLPRYGYAFVLTLMLIPGLWNLYSLHPYQYIYYNSLVGGVSGAFRRFEMDYWGTSFRDVASYLNVHAPPNAQVVVWGPPTTFWRYARQDLTVYDAFDPERPRQDFYALISTRYDNDKNVYPELPTLYQVEKAGAILAVLRYISP